MDKYKMLSGEEIIRKGATKIEITLPEIGIKDVTPNGSWLEQKQIQSALEARKHLVEVQRIEKSGVLSHAEWREDLKLAEVTQQSGGYWQFLGHHRDKRLYLRPEEALFLMEVNCLLLRYNEVIVSLQQAYSLLLSHEISLIQYKVYASLSRLGYKVFRHTPESLSNKIKITLPTNGKKIVMESNQTNLSVNPEVKESVFLHNNKCNVDLEGRNENVVDTDETNLSGSNKIENEPITEHASEEIAEKNTSGTKGIGSEQKAMVIDEDKSIGDSVSRSNVEVPTEMTTEKNNTTLGNATEQELENCSITPMELDNESSPSCSSKPPSHTPKNQPQQESLPSTSNSIASTDPLTKYCQWKLVKLKERRSKLRPILDIHKSFKACPEVSENQIITVNTPKEEYIPKNIYLNNLQYVINVKNVRTRNVSVPGSSQATYSLSDEVSGAHIRRVTNTSSGIPPPSQSQPQPQQGTVFTPFFPSFRPNMPYRQYNYWRPRPQMSYFQFNLFFQRPYMSNYQSRFQFYPRMHMPMFPRYTNPPMHHTVNNEYENLPSNSRKRPKDHTQTTHLENLRNLAHRLKNLSASGVNRIQNIKAVESVINTYNMRFRTNLRLSERFDIIGDESIVDTITLDDEDEESGVKRPRLDDNPDRFLENLNKIRQTALKLKKLESENKSTARHRRALSGVIKTFNKYFKAEIHLTDNYEVLDRRYINLDSSSDSDCVIEEIPKAKSGKKLRNPFNILKKLSEKQKVSPSSPTTSRRMSREIPDTSIGSNTQHSYDVLKKIFKKPWLPGDTDFGRPEVISRDTTTGRFVETKKEDYLFDFLKGQTCKFSNWVDIKIAFLESIEETNAILQTGAMLENNIDIKSLVKPEDCTDMSTVLKKLSIISGNKRLSDEKLVKIDYDVYNRDVRNFRKAKKPKPHFRVVCIDETSTCLSGIDIATLHAEIEDNVAVLFAIVGSGSISFIQMNPTDLPVYLPCNDLG